MEGGGFKQKQVCSCKLVAQECTGRTFLGEDVGGSTQKRDLRNANLVDQKWTRMFIFDRACGWNLLGASDLPRLFQKEYGKRLLK